MRRAGVSSPEQLPLASELRAPAAPRGEHAGSNWQNGAMGCGTSKIGVGTGYGMGGKPQGHDMVKRTAGRPVAVFWDLDDVTVPPTADLCLDIVHALRKVRAPLPTAPKLLTCTPRG